MDGGSWSIKAPFATLTLWSDMNSESLVTFSMPLAYA